MAKLTTAQRKAIPKSDFAIPSNKTKANPAGKGGYPIPDASHARNALSRVAQNGDAEEQAEVRAKVKSKFPGIGGGGKQRSPSHAGGD